MDKLGDACSINNHSDKGENIIEAILKYENGKSLQTIAQELGCSATRVRNYLINSNIKLRKRWQWGIIRNLPADEIRICYLKDVPIKELAKKHGVHPKTIKRILRDLGVYNKERRHYNRRNLDKEEIIRLYKDGNSIEDIALKLNCGAMTIRRRLVEYGFYNPWKKIHKSVNIVTRL